MGEKKDGGKNEGEGKKPDGPNTTVLKLDLHCEGCAKKVKRAIRHFDGVEDVKADASSNKVTVTGNVDPTKLKEQIEEKTGKKAELLSPAPAKKDSGGEGGKGGGGGGDGKKAEDKPKEKKSEDSKKNEPKPAPVMSTVVLKIRLHCDGCTQKIKRVIKKTKAIESFSIDEDKDLITVKGTMDAKDLATYLKDKLKRNIEIVPRKKEGGGDQNNEKEVKKDEGTKKEQNGGEKKEKESGGREKKEKENGPKKEVTGEKKDDTQSKAISTSGEGKKAEESKVEASKLDYYGYPPYSYYTQMQNHGYINEGYNMPHHYNQGYNYDHGSTSHGNYTTQVYANQSYTNPSYTQYANPGYNTEFSHQPPSSYYHGQPYGEYSHAPPPPSYILVPPTPSYLHAPQMFSDENPNACSVM